MTKLVELKAAYAADAFATSDAASDAELKKEQTNDK